MYVAGLLVLLMLLSVVPATTTAEQRKIYVVPNDSPQTQCPTDHCITFGELTEDVYKYFSSNTTIILLPGSHVVRNDKSVFIQGIENLIITGSKSPRGTTANIRCIEPFGMTFANVTNLMISNIASSGCGTTPLIEVYKYVLNEMTLSDYEYEGLDIDHFLCIAYSYNITIHSVTIANGTGIGLLLYNAYGTVNISQTVLTRNDVNCYVLVDTDSDIATEDAAIVVSRSSFMYGNYPMAFNLDLPTTSLWISLVNYLHTYRIDIQDVSVVDNQADKGDIYMSLGTAKANIEVNGLKSILTQNGTRGIYFTGEEYQTWSNFSITNSSFSGSSLMGMLFNNALIQNSTFEGCRESMYFTYCNNITLENVSIVNAIVYEGILEMYSATKIVFRESCFFVNTTGSVIILFTPTVVFDENSTILFKNNNLKNAQCTEDPDLCQPPFIIHGASVTMSTNSHIYFKNNIAITSGGLLLRSVHIKFCGNTTITFEENTGGDGGGLELGRNIKLSVTEGYPIISFIRNSALRGGAIYTGHNERICESDRPIQWAFINNSASVGGSIKYGSVESILTNEYFLKGCDPQYTHIETKSNDISIIASHPTRVCICVNSIPKCNITSYKVELFPNQVFEVDLVAVGWEFGAVSFLVQAEFDRGEFSWQKIGGSQYLQLVRNNCTTLKYNTFLSSIQMKTLNLTVSYDELREDDFDVNYEDLIREHKNDTLLFQDLLVSLTIKNCSLGFAFNATAYHCDCQPKLVESGIRCDTTHFTEIYRPYPKWVNATFTHTISRELGVIVHDHCPFDYCKPDKMIPMNLEYPDKQCSYNRSGILCGECPRNLSQVFGTSKCKKCSNKWILLIIPTVALAGIALVVFLMILNLTVAVGTINGLIFYANIVRANQAIFFSPETSNSFLSWFIAWLNLDLGIETCFYNGLDGYVKTWLQFVFPLYIWAIVVAIIISSRHYVTVGRIAGNNAVKVLATLFLLSYSKLLRSIIGIFQYTTLVYPDGYRRKVWLYDGNVDYLKGKHIPLFMVALLFCIILLCIPYTVVLLTYQWLQRHTHHRILKWVNKLKPVFDAYTGPYKDKHRYWTGVLLLVRALLYLTFSLNVFGDPSINLLSIVITSLCLLAHVALVGGVYRQRLQNFVEISFLLNIGILSGATLYKINISENINPENITIISTSIAFASFIGICVYHMYHMIISSRRLRQMRGRIATKRQQKRENEQPECLPIVLADLDSDYQVSETVIDVNDFSRSLTEEEEGKSETLQSENENHHNTI